MKKIRIGKEFSVRWGLVLNGLPAELDKMDVKVILVNPFGKRSSLVILPTATSRSVIPIDRTLQPMTGAYSLSLWINKDKDGRALLIAVRLFASSPQRTKRAAHRYRPSRKVSTLVQAKSSWECKANQPIRHGWTKATKVQRRVFELAPSTLH